MIVISLIRFYSWWADWSRSVGPVTLKLDWPSSESKRHSTSYLTNLSVKSSRKPTSVDALKGWTLRFHWRGFKLCPELGMGTPPTSEINMRVTLDRLWYPFKWCLKEFTRTITRWKIQKFREILFFVILMFFKDVVWKS